MKDKSVSTRIHKLKFECRLHLQLCAIYSQLHRHKDAYEQALEGVKLAHLVVRDQLAICYFFTRKSEFEKETTSAREESKLADDSGAKLQRPTNSRAQRSYKKSKDAAKRPGVGKSKEVVYDEVSDDMDEDDDGNDLFFIDVDDKSVSEADS